MRNRVFVYDESQNLISKYSIKMEKFLFSRGLFDFSFLTSTDFEQFQEILNDSRENDSCVVVICDNDKLDRCLEKVKKEGDELSLLEEQAIRLENLSQNEKMLFVPFEVDFERFLQQFLPEEKVKTFSVFGKSRKFVCERLETLKNEYGYSYEIITKHPYLHIVYCSDCVEQDSLEETFGENLFSMTNETLAGRLDGLLSASGQTLKVVEFGTGGRLSSCLDCKGEVLQSFDDLEKIGVSQEVLVSENAGKEVAFALSKHGLSKESGDLVLSVCDGLGDKTFVSVGDKNVVHLYSSSFSGLKEERLEVLCDFAIFRMICYLKNQKA